ncbi:MAG TPA: SpoIIE family protein phosphatase [Leptospiraceae bacterium]|nr:SpoIIE family protein phosphatase [Leptospiraceae bacterium]HMW07580.1 SpoIIE family protein phosphatase [Leptospiraceae bacterium]HMX33042.1 SpoIIE family protein phosphatase [Leptospiraceae bacterium]HMY33205.1 SpoIIE family protein phosphatase [Leptospiraceae bacterium]HMZ65075.1 SpoIIE family protein phosphatase [Leptospiraceae bacterium]
MKNLSWRIILPGIRAKLSLFTILFVGIIIFVMSQLFIRQQKMTLEESYEKEITASKSYIENVVSDLEGISRSLILIEGFRDQIKENQKALAALKKTYFVEEKSFMGLFKINRDFGLKKLGLIQSKKSARKIDTFFSIYYTEKDIKELEANIKTQFKDKDGKPISDKVFSDLQRYANQVVKAESLLEKNLENKAADSVIAANRKNLSTQKAQLRKQILNQFQEEQKRKIKELGLPTTKIRIQSFSLLSQGDQVEAEIGFDTNIFETKGEVNSKSIDDYLQNGFNQQVGILAKQDLSATSKDKFILDQKNYQTQSDLFYKNHLTVETAEKLNSKYLTSEWKEYFEKEKEIQTKFKEISDKLKARIEVLKADKTRVSPSRDLEFRKLYIEYAQNLQKREALVNEITKKIPNLENLEKTNLDFSNEQSLHIKNAILNLRDVALYEDIILKYKSNPTAYLEYASNEKLRQEAKIKWKKMRQWIMDANSETVPADLKKMITEGTISKSRSEAEELMWELDANPIYSEDEKNLAKELQAANQIGFTRTVIDMQEGYNRIEEQKNKILYTSYFIGVVAFFLALYLSDRMVRKIKRIIHSAAELGQGNLDTKFQHGGSDEFGVLTTALNQMTVDLKHRQEMLIEYAAAEEIQKGLLPVEMPSNANGILEFGNFYKSMSGVGGDYFDFMNSGEDKIVFCIGDVSNHGIGPALVMVALRSQLQSLVRNGETDLRKILLSMNEQIYADTPSHIFVTFFLGIYDKKTGKVNYMNCGHSKPFLYRAISNKVESLPSGGMPLGAIDNDIFDTTIEEESIQLEKGDLFFQYTDGVNEAMNGKSELFGSDRMEEIILKYGKESPEKVTNEIAKQVEIFSGKKIFCTGPSELNDDIAMIAFRRVN